DINWLAVLAAAAAAFVLGGLWYGPLLGNAWMRSMGMDPVAARKSARPGLRRLLTITFILEWVMAVCLAMFIGNTPTAIEGATYGFLAGLPWVAFAIVINGLYEQKSVDYMLINGAYWTLAF